MPSLCHGVLCNAKAKAGVFRAQGRKAYDFLCPACFHAANGTKLQVHRSGGATDYCLNWPSCQHWARSLCNGYRFLSLTNPAGFRFVFIWVCYINCSAACSDVLDITAFVLSIRPLMNSLPPSLDCLTHVLFQLLRYTWRCSSCAQKTRCCYQS